VTRPLLAAALNSLKWRRSRPCWFDQAADCAATGGCRQLTALQTADNQRVLLARPAAVCRVRRFVAAAEAARVPSPHLERPGATAWHRRHIQLACMLSCGVGAFERLAASVARVGPNLQAARAEVSRQSMCAFWFEPHPLELTPASPRAQLWWFCLHLLQGCFWVLPRFGFGHRNQQTLGSC
jgi:hypothetical protein